MLLDDDLVHGSGRTNKANVVMVVSAGTFTISNGRVFGSLMGTPIINQPQGAILGMHATKMRAIMDEKGNVMAWECRHCKEDVSFVVF